MLVLYDRERDRRVPEAQSGLLVSLRREEVELPDRRRKGRVTKDDIFPSPKPLEEVDEGLRGACEGDGGVPS